ncbi:PepSY-associated TM helix domain-containing protein [Olivibacter domesticus]|uniref:Uncharacterized iron-regulated membrane protein n=1 Tax=Olivibacter domesticus TaxID=407022 RepID=A0A1H7WE42_OLID1|nr:PepSY-associated TM helix domain-containing protein [Olivibacter domesticus]SEM19187.1 Uncharacterized iron-regulated membrane protein [Olivibacter domesticus]
MSKRNYATKLAFSLHSWLGLISGIFLLLLGLSGSALVFLKEIDLALHSGLLHVKPTGKVMSLDTIYRKIGEEHPRLAGIAWLNPDAATNEAYEFRLYQNDGKLSTYDLGMMSIDPYSGRILREGNLKDLNAGFLHWLVQFHWSFQLGIPGLLLATIFGITMLLSSITGIIIYRKYVWKVLLFKVKIKWKNWRTISSGIHRFVGVWALIFQVVIFFTGFWMNKFSLDPEYWKRQTVLCPMNTLSMQSMDMMLLKTQKQMPDLIINKVYLPTQPGKNFRASGKVKGQAAIFGNVNAVSVNPTTGEIVSTERLAEKDVGKKLEATFFSLHVGDFGGIPVKVLYVLVGLLPGLLSITGALLWWRRVKIGS